MHRTRRDRDRLYGADRGRRPSPRRTRPGTRAGTPRRSPRGHRGRRQRPARRSAAMARATTSRGASSGRRVIARHEGCAVGDGQLRALAAQRLGGERGGIAAQFHRGRVELQSGSVISGAGQLPSTLALRRAVVTTPTAEPPVASAVAGATISTSAAVPSSTSAPLPARRLGHVRRRQLSRTSMLGMARTLITATSRRAARRLHSGGAGAAMRDLQALREAAALGAVERRAEAPPVAALQPGPRGSGPPPRPEIAEPRAGGDVGGVQLGARRHRRAHVAACARPTSSLAQRRGRQHQRAAQQRHGFNAAENSQATPTIKTPSTDAAARVSTRFRPPRIASARPAPLAAVSITALAAPTTRP